MNSRDESPAKIPSELDWETRLKDPDPARRVAAIVALQHLAHRALPYAPLLLDLLDDPERTVRERATGALGMIGGVKETAKDRLRRALGDESPRVRVGAAHVLWKTVPDPEPVLPVLIACLRDEDAFVRWNAASTLGEMGPAAAPALPALMLALHDRDDGVQMHAARALGNLALAPDQVIPALISLLREHSTRLIEAESERLHLVVHSALHHFGALAVPYLTNALAEEGDDFRLRVASVLGHLGHLSAPALAALTPLLASESGALRRRAAFVIGQIGPDAEEAAPLFETLLGDSDPTVRVAVAQALWRIGSWSETAFNILMNAVVEDRTPWSARANAIQALGGLGPAAAAATPSLRRLLAQSSTPKTDRASAALALWQIAGDLGALENCFADALQDQDPEYRTQVLRILPSLGAAGAPFVERVQRLVFDSNPTVRATAESILKRLKEA